MSSSPWHINVTAVDHEEAVAMVRFANLPRFATEHFLGLLRGQESHYVRYYHPADEPLRVVGSGNDYGTHIDLVCAHLKYLGVGKGSHYEIR